jgi:hypothetical protein
MSRFYNSTFGRFMGPDPGGAGASSSNPTSWNRYAYVLGDPVNGDDPTGLGCNVSVSNFTAFDIQCNDPGNDDGGVYSPGSDPCGVGMEFGASVSACVAVGVGVSTGVPADSLAAQLNALESGGLINGWQITPTGVDFSLTAADVTAIEVCVLNPEICAVLAGAAATVYVTYVYLPTFINNLSNIYKATSWRAGRVPTVQEIEMNCTPVGPPGKVRSTNTRNRGGWSIEQEYLCPDGSNYTIHTIYKENGTIFDPPHIRAGAPRYGGAGTQ